MDGVPQTGQKGLRGTELLGAIHGNQKAMDGFAQMNAGTISPAEFSAIVAATQVSS